MQQQQPGMPSFSPAAGTPVGAGQHAATPAAAPSPISSRPPEGQQQQQQVVDELGGSASADHDGMSAGGDEGERGGASGGNRWPRQETLALLKIRSEMDAAFREAALKGPLWEQVSRKLEAMGYKRSAKKCREKFENVDKYYKRTKDGRAGRGDGKAYRFFSELEALHGAAASPSSRPSPALHPASSLAPTPVAMAPPATAAMSLAPAMHAAEHHQQPLPPRVASVPHQPAPPPVSGSTTAAPVAACTMTGGDMMSFSSGSDDDGDEDTDQDTGDDGAGKRKRQGDDGGGGSSKMMRFFSGLMRQVMERQEEMQQRFMETMERREQERMIREEAWRRQEVARLAREQDALAQERAMAASRDAAVVSFIQRVTGQTIPMPPSVISASPPAFITTAAMATPPLPLQPTPVASAAPSIQLSPKPPQHTMAAKSTAQPQPQQQHQTPPPPPPAQQQQQQQQQKESHNNDTAAGSGAPSPSRWPKAEVHALIQLRTELEARYQDSGPKGPLWEDISAGMRRLGYNRSAKRCKEKWENINKYFKKVKESNKKRPEDSKTCPYYHQLEALYRTKALAAGGAAAVPAPPSAVTVLAAVPLSQTAPHAAGHDVKDCSNGNGCAAGNGGTSGATQTQATNGGVAASGNGVATTKQEAGIVMTTKETATEARPQPVSMNDSYVNDDTVDSDSSMDDDEDDFDDDDDDGNGGGAGGNSNSKMQYEIQFQRQQQSQSASGGAGSGPGPAATTSGSFLTMVHH